MLRGRHPDARGEVFQTDSSLRLVLPLTAWATRTKGLKDDLLFEGLDIGIKLRHIKSQIPNPKLPIIPNIQCSINRNLFFLPFGFGY